MNQAVPQPAGRREIFGWAMYDFANSGYTTVVLTAIFNVYFVKVVAGEATAINPGTGTLLWTIAVAIANGLVILSGPVVGAIADYSAAKKRFLLASTIGCVGFTALLALVGPGDVILGMTLVILASVMFSTGENFIAAFLPEISTQEHMGRTSAFGWTIGYLGGLLVLGLCLAYVGWAEARGQGSEQFVPVTMLIVAAMFALAATPTFLLLKERAVPLGARPQSYLRIGFARLRDTVGHARRHQDLFRFLASVALYHCGINTVVVLATVYAQDVMGFTFKESVMLILVVNITAAAGAFIFGRVQDRLGSKPTLALTLLIWILATFLAYGTESRTTFWIVANLVGLAMGSSQSAGRALVGQFSPPQRSAEFFGLWGLAVKLAYIVGPISYGLISHWTGGDHRQAILSTIVFFILGLVMLATVNEARGKQAAVASSKVEVRSSN